MAYFVPSDIPDIVTLRERLNSDIPLTFHNPLTITEPSTRISSDMKEGEFLIVTTHPSRSWYARIEHTKYGWKVS